MVWCFIRHHKWLYLDLYSTSVTFSVLGTNIFMGSLFLNTFKLKVRDFTKQLLQLLSTQTLSNLHVTVNLSCSMNRSLWFRKSMLTPRSSNLGAKKILTVPTFGLFVLFSTCNQWHSSLPSMSLLHISRNGWSHPHIITYLDLVREICMLEVSEPCKHIATWSKVNTPGKIHIIFLPIRSELIFWRTRCLYIHRTNSDSIVYKLQDERFIKGDN